MLMAGRVPFVLTQAHVAFEKGKARPGVFARYRRPKNTEERLCSRVEKEGSFPDVQRDQTGGHASIIHSLSGLQFDDVFLLRF